MYADGDGVQHDDLKAFEYFSKLADQNADESPDSPNAGVVVERLRGARHLFPRRHQGHLRQGQSGARRRDVPATRRRYFGDSNAQYNLARLYLEGTGVEQDARQAARWFNLAAEKGHHRVAGAARPPAR